MPTYDFDCPTHGVASIVMSLHEVRATAPCPVCRAESRRVYVSPQLRLGDGTARRLLDATARTADEPSVVSSPAGRRLGRPRRTPELDPRTARLPRP